MKGLIKHPLDPDRIRPVPRQFGALDRGLVYRAWSRHLSLEELALYVFLICVGDPQGLSYYSDRRIAELRPLEPWQVGAVRETLCHKGLILYQAPLYQLLELPEAPCPQTKH